MKKEELRKSLFVRNDEYSIGVMVDVAPKTPSAIASCDCTHENGAWLVTRVWVPEIYRGQGVGSFLVTELKTAAITKPGFKSMIVAPGGYGSDPERLEHFYAKNGFNLVTEGPWEGAYEWKRGTVFQIVPASLIDPAKGLRAQDYVKQEPGEDQS